MLTPGVASATADGGEPGAAVPVASEPPEKVRRLAAIREEMRFELGLLHERVNVLIAAESFLTISYTMALGSGRAAGAGVVAAVAPILALVGLVLALLAWPGIETTCRIILAWSRAQIELLDGDERLAATMLRRDVAGAGTRRLAWDERRGMLFARVVPGVFGAVWAGLLAVALVAIR